MQGLPIKVFDYYFMSIFPIFPYYILYIFSYIHKSSLHIVIKRYNEQYNSKLWLYDSLIFTYIYDFNHTWNMT